MFKKPQNPARESNFAISVETNEGHAEKSESNRVELQRKRACPLEILNGKRVRFVGNLQSTNHPKQSEDEKNRMIEKNRNHNNIERQAACLEYSESIAVKELLRTTNAPHPSASQSRQLTSQQPAQLETLSAQLENSTITGEQGSANKSNRTQIISQKPSNSPNTNEIHPSASTKLYNAAPDKCNSNNRSNIYHQRNANSSLCNGTSGGLSAHLAKQTGPMHGELVGHIAVCNEMSARFMSAVCALEGRVALLLSSECVCVSLELVKRQFAQQMHPDLLEFAIRFALRLPIRVGTAEESAAFRSVQGSDSTANRMEDKLELISLSEFLDRLPDLLESFHLNI